MRGEECGYVMSGNFEIWIDNEKFTLGEGDSFSFPSNKPHRYRNPGDGVAVVVWAMTPPSY
ncbi:MAG: cupin domain-containing protein [Sulfitobacter sp. SK025]|nr:MAG: cupin domain-containing protein [Sulfitobacter sp. SK025]